MDATFSEVVETVERLREALDLLVMRGLRAAGADQISQLESYAGELRGIGAEHLATSLDTLVAQTQSGERAAARTLLTTQASLRTFERLVTLRAVAWQLAVHEEDEEA